jgi:hypothetical protein
MKLAIIVLVVVGVLFVATLFLVGTGGNHSAFNPPPTKADGSVDQDALSGWTPPSLAQVMSDAGSMFAPHADFGTPSVLVPAGASQVISAKPSDNDIDIATLKVAAGALLVSYACKHKKDDSSCSQTVCLCAPGTPLTSLAVALCKDDTHWKQAAAPGVCSSAELLKGTILVYPEARNLGLTALGPSVTVSLK